MSSMISQTVRFTEFIKNNRFQEFDDELYCIENDSVYMISEFNLDGIYVRLVMECILMEDFAQRIRNRKNHLFKLDKIFSPYLIEKKNED